MGGSSNTGKYKSFKEMPWWLKLVVVGVPAFVLLGVPFQMFMTLENKAFDAQLEQKIQRIHAQIAESKFREVFIEGDRELFASYDENEFAAKLAKGQSQLVGKYQKMTSDSLHYADVYNRLKRVFGRPALACNYYSLKSDARAGSETFCWILRGDELRLVDYDFRELDRQLYN